MTALPGDGQLDLSIPRGLAELRAASCYARWEMGRCEASLMGSKGMHPIANPFPISLLEWQRPAGYEPRDRALIQQAGDHGNQPGLWVRDCCGSRDLVAG